MASWAAANIFFSVFLFCFGKKIVKIILTFFFFENEGEKRSQSALIDSPGRWTGNNIFSKGGLTCVTSKLHYAPLVLSGR